jgi:uncharacterized damage-inducible protein DinB
MVASRGWLFGPRTGMLSHMTEPWLRGTLTEVPVVARAVLHALQLAEEDLEKWCAPLSEQELFVRPLGLTPVAFHLRHIARSLDRLLTYAEGRELDHKQMAALRAEEEGSGSREELLAELHAALTKSAERIRALDLAPLEAPRSVGKKALPTTLGGLLVHVADHTQRHAGQAVTTAKAVTAQRT